jgi:hypothetical protein
MQAGLWARLIPFATPETVPPVPAPAIKTSTFPDDGWIGVEGVDITAAMISGAVVSSCASGLFTWVQGMRRNLRTNKDSVRCDIDLELCHLVSLFASAGPHLQPRKFNSAGPEGNGYSTYMTFRGIPGGFIGSPHNFRTESA